MVPARTAQRYAQDQGQERGGGRGPQALEADRQGPRACGLDSFAPLASWRHGPRTKAARLQLRAAEEDVAGRVALGALGKIGGAKADGRGRLDARNAQDQGAAGRAGQTES